MNRFGLAVWEHLVRTRPDDLTAITDPTAWFQQLGEQIETEITTTLHAMPTTADRAAVEATVVGRYLVLHPSDMLVDPTDPLPDWLTDYVAMVNAEAIDRQRTTSGEMVIEPEFTALTRATEAWLARRPREIVIPVSMINDPLVSRWRAAGHTITTRAV